MLFYLIDIRKIRKNKKKKTSWLKLVIGILLFGLGLTAFLIFNFHASEPYKKATAYLKTNSKIVNEIGNFKGFGFIPTGSIYAYEDYTSGKAIFYLTIRGDKKYMDLKVETYKKPETDWIITSIEKR